MNSLLSGLSSSAHEIEIKSTTGKVEHNDAGDRPKFKDAMDKQVASSRSTDKADKGRHNDSAKEDDKATDNTVNKFTRDDNAPAPEVAGEATRSGKGEDDGRVPPADTPSATTVTSESQGVAPQVETPQVETPLEHVADNSSDLLSAPSLLTAETVEVEIADGDAGGLSPAINAEPALTGIPVLADEAIATAFAATTENHQHGLAQTSGDALAQTLGLTATPTHLTSAEALGKQQVPSETGLASLALTKEQVVQNALTGRSTNPLGSANGSGESRVLNALNGDMASGVGALDHTTSENAVKHHLRMEFPSVMGGVKQLNNTVVAPASGQSSLPLVSESQLRFDELMMVTTSASSGQERPLAAATAINTFGVSSTGLPNVTEARMQMPVNIRFGDAGWGAMIAERSAMMASKSIKFAELQLDPPELGPLQVKVTVNQEQASVSFVAANAQVRDALDQSLVRLREMLQEQGLDLVNVDVSDQSSQGSDADAEPEANETALNELEQEGADDASVSHATATVSYGVDHYA